MNKFWKSLIEAPPAARLLVAALALLMPVAPAAATGTFTWDQDVSSIWSDEDNWSPPAGCSSDCFPHTTDDDAIIAEEADDEIKLDDDYEIDDMTILEDEFESILFMSSDGSAKELSCDSIVIEGYVEAYVWDKVKLIARQSETP